MGPVDPYIKILDKCIIFYESRMTHTAILKKYSNCPEPVGPSFLIGSRLTDIWVKSNANIFGRLISKRTNLSTKIASNFVLMQFGFWIARYWK